MNSGGEAMSLPVGMCACGLRGCMTCDPVTRHGYGCNPWLRLSQPGLGDADIERIARRVAEIIENRNA